MIGLEERRLVFVLDGSASAEHSSRSYLRQLKIFLQLLVMQLAHYFPRRFKAYLGGFGT